MAILFCLCFDDGDCWEKSICGRRLVSKKNVMRNVDCMNSFSDSSLGEVLLVRHDKYTVGLLAILQYSMSGYG
eukprot:scaffold12585_cov60-Cylindrotheca_fusiformis.AAC.1